MVKLYNSNLHKAKKAKNDEFYTLLPDIEKELSHYESHFKDKVVYSNCDTEDSMFVKYFNDNAERLGIKKFIYMGYNPETGDGDFRSEESIVLLKEADIIVTNPPFSLFREYIAQLMEYEKKFIIIGSLNAITYKEVFKLIKDNMVWLGNTYPKQFLQPDGSIKKFGNIGWYTNLEIKKRTEDIILYKKYKKKDYPKYDNYDAIEVSKVKDIPADYDGVMGVPITFLDKYNPEQFEILGIANSARWIGEFECFTIIDGKKIYNRILIRKKVKK